MNCVYCEQVKGGVRQVCPLHPDVKRAELVRRTMGSLARVEEQRRERKRRYWAGFGVGDGVLLSGNASAKLKRVYNDQGEQIRFDGVIRELGDVYATVFVLMQTGKDSYGLTMLAKPDDLEANEGVTCWMRGRERSMDRKRRTGSVETDYWAPM